jgi:hypothetical protein
MDPHMSTFERPYLMDLLAAFLAPDFAEAAVNAEHDLFRRRRYGRQRLHHR